MMDSKDKKIILYLGLEKPTDSQESVIHYPIIQIVPMQPFTPEIIASFSQLPFFTHLIFTSKSSVKIFAEFLDLFGLNFSHLESKIIIAVGNTTAQHLQKHLFPATIIAKNETAEGIIEEINKLNLSDAYVFWPHSALSRPLIKSYLDQKQVKNLDCILYNTIPCHNLPLPDLTEVDEIVFTSPSCVNAFVHIFGSLPTNKTLTPIGPITALELCKMTSTKETETQSKSVHLIER